MSNITTPSFVTRPDVLDLVDSVSGWLSRIFAMFGLGPPDLWDYDSDSDEEAKYPTDKE